MSYTDYAVLISRYDRRVGRVTPEAASAALETGALAPQWYATPHRDQSAALSKPEAEALAAIVNADPSPRAAKIIKH